MPTITIDCAACGGTPEEQPRKQMFTCEYCKKLNLITDHGTVILELPEALTPEDTADSTKPKTPSPTYLKTNWFGHLAAAIFLIAVLVNFITGNILTYMIISSIFIVLYLGLGSDSMPGTDPSDGDFGGFAWVIAMVSLPIVGPMLLWGMFGFILDLLLGFILGCTASVVAAMVALVLSTVRD